MNVQKALCDVQKSYTRMQNARQKYMELQSQALSCTAPMGERVQSSPMISQTEMAVLIIEAEEKFWRTISRYDSAKRFALYLISRCYSYSQRKAMRERYINFCSWSAVAKKIGCTRQQAYRLSENGIKNIEKIFSENPQKTQEMRKNAGCVNA